MSVKLIESLKTKALSRAKYNEVANEVLQLMGSDISRSTSTYGTILSYERKQKFNGIDILCTNPGDALFRIILDTLKLTNKPEMVARAGNNLCVNYKGCQVNFIGTEDGTYHVQKFLRQYEGFGVMVHRIFRSMGIGAYLDKNGLAITLDSSMAKVASNSLVLSTSPQDICTSLGINYGMIDQYVIVEMSNIYEAGMSSPFFSIEAMQPINEVEADAQKDSELFMGIEAYYNTHLSSSDPESGSNAKKPRYTDTSRVVLLDSLLRHFHAKGSYIQKLKHLKMSKLSSEIMSGSKISEWTGITLTPPQHMEFIAYYKTRHPNLTTWFRNRSEAFIKTDLLKNFEEWYHLVKHEGIARVAPTTSEIFNAAA